MMSLDLQSFKTAGFLLVLQGTQCTQADLVWGTKEAIQSLLITQERS
jgi:hypothetical protein